MIQKQLIRFTGSFREQRDIYKDLFFTKRLSPLTSRTPRLVRRDCLSDVLKALYLLTTVPMILLESFCFLLRLWVI